MQYVQKYMELYPQDKVVITGGAAASLILEKCGAGVVPMKNIDVNINTTGNKETILERWVSIVPSSYTAKFDSTCSLAMFILLDRTEKDLSIVVLINERVIDLTEQIGLFHVERLASIVNRYYLELLGFKKDMELIESGAVKWNLEEFPILIDEYNRLLERFRLLAQYLKY